MLLTSVNSDPYSKKIIKNSVALVCFIIYEVISVVHISVQIYSYRYLTDIFKYVVIWSFSQTKLCLTFEIFILIISKLTIKEGSKFKCTRRFYTLAILWCSKVGKYFSNFKLYYSKKSWMDKIIFGILLTFINGHRHT